MVKVTPKEKKLGKSTCLFCSLGCGTAFRMEGSEARAIDYDLDNPVNRWALCARGNYNFELLNHPQRLTSCLIGNRKVSWEEAIEFSRQQLREFMGESTRVVLFPNASNQDVFAAARLADTFGTKNICIAGNSFDQQAYQGARYAVPGAEIAALDEIQNADALLIIGDILRRTPVLSWRINKMKYGKRGNQLFVIDPNRSHTAWFATNHLINRPGTEALVVLSLLEIISKENGRGGVGLDVDRVAEITGVPVENIIRAAKEFNSAKSGVIIVVPGAFKQRNDLLNYFSRLLAATSPGKKQICFYGFGNPLGASRTLDQTCPEHINYPDIIRRIENGQTKALISFGSDLSRSHPEIQKKIALLKFTLAASFFTQPQSDEVAVTLPLATQMEQTGTYTMADGRNEKLSPIAPKVGALGVAEIAALLMSENYDYAQTNLALEGIMGQAVTEKVELNEKVKEALAIQPLAEAEPEDITHFGNNSLAEHFFWYRVNNKI
jgi:anaerobic selenocysteine-containing dehydrogenase